MASSIDYEGIGVVFKKLETAIVSVTLLNKVMVAILGLVYKREEIGLGWELQH